MEHALKEHTLMEHTGTQKQYVLNRNPVQFLQENSIIVIGPRWYNGSPKYPRDMKSVKTEKSMMELEKYLALIHDEPKPNYVTASRSNSILDLLSFAELKETPAAVEPPTWPRIAGLTALKPL